MDTYISTYTRAQAIEDGTLIDVSRLAREAGFRVPVAISTGIQAALENIPYGSPEDYMGRLWDVLHMARLAAKRAAPGENMVHFEVIINQPRPANRKPQCYAVIGPGDNLEPVMTIMLNGED